MGLRRFFNLRFYGTRSMCIQKPNVLGITDSQKIPLHKTLTPIHSELTPKLMMKNSHFDNEFWSSVREQVLKTTDVNNEIIDSIFFNICVKANRVDAAKSYINFLKANNLPLNLSIIGNYLKMFSCQETLSEEDEKQILQIYAGLREKHPDLDEITASRCISGLSLTKKWKETLELFEMIKLNAPPPPSVYFTIICTAFKNAEPDIAWKFIHEVSSMHTLHEQIYHAHLDYCKTNLSEKSDFVQEVEKMLGLWSENNIIPSKAILDLYLKECKRFEWLGTVVQAQNNMTVCKNCSIPLKPKLTDDDCKKLLDVIVSNDMIGKDLYSNSTPTEFQRFLKFVDKHKPFDVVIDGLNIYYALMTVTHKSRGVHSKDAVLAGQAMLAEVVRTLKNEGQRILLVGRQHLWKYQSPHTKYISQYSKVFRMENISQDDPFILYATLASGINSKFVTRDLLRQHKYSLQDPQIQALFREWQWTHQYGITFGEKGKAFLTEPPLFHPAVTKCGDCWHIPLVLTEVSSRLKTSEPPKAWICLKHRSHK